MVSASRLSSAGQPRGKPAVKAATGPHNPTARVYLVRLVTPCGYEEDVDVDPQPTFDAALRYVTTANAVARVGRIRGLLLSPWQRRVREVVRRFPAARAVVVAPAVSGGDRLGGYREVTAAE